MGGFEVNNLTIFVYAEIGERDIKLYLLNKSNNFFSMVNYNNQPSVELNFFIIFQFVGANSCPTLITYICSSMHNIIYNLHIWLVRFKKKFATKLL